MFIHCNDILLYMDYACYWKPYSLSPNMTYQISENLEAKRYGFKMVRQL